MSIGYLSVILIALVLGLGSQAWIKRTYAKWSRVPISSGMTGAEAARRMLDSNGLYGVDIDMISGQLSDNYDPRTNTLHLSRDVYGGRTVAATAIACHEAGHAIQHATGYTPIKVRKAILPIASMASNIWIFLLFIGFFMNMIGLVWAAIIMYACVVLFQLVTLPVEFDASGRALRAIQGSFPLSHEQNDGAAAVLRSAAFTYVAAALASLLQLLYFIGMTRD
ncbi:MAG: zinc metallopeptidase [Coriobacteriales bacterium]|jgi:Zn-dependent membrane protease YugP